LPTGAETEFWGIARRMLASRTGGPIENCGGDSSALLTLDS
jgi:hypothetical protein